MDAQGHHKGLFTKNHQVLRHGSMVRHWARVYLDEARPKIPGGHPDDLLFFCGEWNTYPLYPLIIAIVSGSHHQPNSTMECNKGFDVWSLFVFEKIRARSWTVSTLLHADFCWVIKETPGKNGMHVANSTAKALEKWWLEDYTPES